MKDLIWKLLDTWLFTACLCIVLPLAMLDGFGLLDFGFGPK